MMVIDCCRFIDPDGSWELILLTNCHHHVENVILLFVTLETPPLPRHESVLSKGSIHLTPVYALHLRSADRVSTLPLRQLTTNRISSLRCSIAFLRSPHGHQIPRNKKPNAHEAIWLPQNPPHNRFSVWRVVKSLEVNQSLWTTEIIVILRYSYLSSLQECPTQTHSGDVFSLWRNRKLPLWRATHPSGGV